MCLLPAATLETLRGKGFRHQKLVANAFLTVSAFADFLQCAVSDVSDFHNKCVGAGESEVFLATVRLQQPTLFETSATALSPSSSTVASCTSGVAPAPGTQPPKRRRTWVPRCSRRGPLPTALGATEEPLHYTALLWCEFGSYVTLTDQLQEAHRKLTLERLRAFASRTLRSALATLTRWRTWFQDAAYTGPPTTLLVAMWLRSLQDGSRHRRTRRGRPFAGWSPIWASSSTLRLPR